MADERHDAAFIVGAILGGLAGAVGTLFWAPQSGAETRTQLAERWNAAAERAAQGVATVDTRARDLAARAGEGVAPVVERLERIRPGTDASPAEVIEAEATIEVDVEPVFTLPDPLEPDPVVDEAADAAVDVPTALDPTSAGAAEAAPEAKADGPRPASFTGR